MGSGVKIIDVAGRVLDIAYSDRGSVRILDTVSRELLDLSDVVQTAAYESATDDAVRTLKRSGMLNAAKLVEALAQDRKAVREKKAKTGFPSLRESVPLPL